MKQMGVRSCPSVGDVMTALVRIARDPLNFHQVGLSCSLLNDTGVSKMMSVYNLLEAMLQQTGDELSPAKLLDLSWRSGLEEKVANIRRAGEAFPWMLYDHCICWSEDRVRACLEPSLLDAVVRQTDAFQVLDAELAFTCPHLVAALRVPYLEEAGLLVWNHDNNNLECELNEVSRRFQQTLQDPAVRVVSCGYLSTNLVTSSVHQLSPETYEAQRDSCTAYRIEANVPFIVFGRSVC